eukprot:352176-Chlamydomonas_euryale.AAC.1
MRTQHEPLLARHQPPDARGACPLAKTSTESSPFRRRTSTVTPPPLHLRCHTSTVTPALSQIHRHTSAVTRPPSHLRRHASAVTPPLSHLHCHTSTITCPLSHIHRHTSTVTPPLANLHCQTPTGKPPPSHLRCHTCAVTHLHCHTPTGKFALLTAHRQTSASIFQLSHQHWQTFTGKRLLANIHRQTFTGTPPPLYLHHCISSNYWLTPHRRTPALKLLLAYLHHRYHRCLACHQQHRRLSLSLSPSPPPPRPPPCFPPAPAWHSCFLNPPLPMPCPHAGMRQIRQKLASTQADLRAQLRQERAAFGNIFAGGKLYQEDVSGGTNGNGGDGCGGGSGASGAPGSAARVWSGGAGGSGGAGPRSSWDTAAAAGGYGGGGGDGDEEWPKARRPRLRQQLAEADKQLRAMQHKVRLVTRLPVQSAFARPSARAFSSKKFRTAGAEHNLH